MKSIFKLEDFRTEKAIDISDFDLADDVDDILRETKKRNEWITKNLQVVNFWLSGL